MPELDCQRRGTDNATVVKLNLVRLIRRSNLAVPLQMSDCIDERGVSPGFNRSLRMRGSDDVSSRLFDYAEPVEFQLTDDRCLPCTRRAGDDEPSHVVFFFSSAQDQLGVCCPHKRRGILLRSPSNRASRFPGIERLGSFRGGRSVGCPSPVGRQRRAEDSRRCR